MAAASLNVPIFNPPPTTHVAEPAALSDTQQKLLQEFREKIPELISNSPVPEEDQAFLSDACLLRYLRATKWVLPDAVKKISNTLEWRHTYQPHKIPASEVEEEGKTGKSYFNGFDRAGRALLYLRPGRQNTKTYERQLRFTIFTIEKAIQLLPPGAEQFCLLIDYKGASMAKNPPLSQAAELLSILHAHYPERLGLAYLIDTPWYFSGFFKLVSPFIDPVTRNKINFVDRKKAEQMGEKLDMDYVEQHIGGKFDFEYDHSVYWKALLEATNTPS
ncbi:CRAL/TRIO domain-containing protein [Basidiobolus meristosporus CBS 931.73]|uniref:CRAL/TRIO domain-containing protein n=1 Tax=Basidiobolus meristosporus CBS 931.73 TaxID=1314790 RepID=A0A1Y1XZ57_9FUNG|nr:CRAL/TRIO domain-containing protein [Basidiobolus meristosporus CBS 931.73]|eukprot:ORX91053.1 CRAL/TRIO domain-containing protein [Basidiobolus meristosporus CBS 931.73]